MLFLANLYWVAALLVPWWSGAASDESAGVVAFWQIYFLTTPHRWLTLLVVATDPDRRGGRTWAFVWPAAAALLIIAGTRWTTGAFTCLALVDYVWNTWHFAAQHGGILRMYARRAGGTSSRWETRGVRLLVVYTGLRLAGWTTGWTELSPLAERSLRTFDLVILCVPIMLLASQLLSHPRALSGKGVYLASVCGLYASLLWAVRAGNLQLVLVLTVASAMFHAVEYLAIVSYYAQRRRSQGTAALFQTMAQHWLALLAVYLIALGLLAVVATRWAAELWLGVNLWAAALHYTYDGMIWKLRQPATAQLLGVESSPPSEVRP